MPGPGPWAPLSAALAADRARWPLWLPVAFAGGIAGYFALPVEPRMALVLAALAPPLATAWLWRGQNGVMWSALAVLAVVLGVIAATLRTAWVDTVMLDRAVWADVTGTVIRLEHRPDDLRITLDAVTLDAVRPPNSSPSRVRVVVRGGGSLAAHGDRVRLRARLSPPPPPSVPGGFDFQRRAYFDGLGAVGFAVGAVVVLDAAPRFAVATAVAELRATIAARLAQALPGATGAVAAALMVGERAGLDPETTAAFRDSGLAHLLAISGLHMGLVAGTLFATLRLGLCLIPRLALRWPLKKIAALAALAGSLAYLVLAGAPVPTQRAFLMTGIVLVAVLLDREAVTPRLVALAAVAVLALRPDVLVGPSFQLSFAAVIALVAVYESWRGRRAGARSGGVLAIAVRVGAYVGGVAVTSVVATVATAPFVTFHFQAIALGGIVTNLLAVPLTAFVTMPAGIAALLALPLGGEGLFLPIMGAGIEATLAVAEGTVEAVGPATAVYPLPVGGLAAMALGGCWMAIWRTWLRWLGLMPVVAGLGAWLAVSPPDVLVSADGRLSAVAAETGGAWALSRARGNRFTRSVWERRWGVAGSVTLTAYDRGAGATPSDLACDALGCTLRRRGRLLSLVSGHEAALEDCRSADIVIAVVRLRAPCHGPAIVIHRPDLWRDGAHAIWLSADRLVVETVSLRRGRRPWVTGSASQ